MKNKKGFTLVELLAVIVILALIMSIAIVSIGGVLNSARQSTLKETAVSIINGVRQQIIVANELKEGDYVFSKALLEKGGDKSPLGGEFKIASEITCNGSGDVTIGANICRKGTAYTGCSAGTDPSYVRVSLRSGTTNVYEYKICLAAGDGNKYIDLGEEKALLDSNDTSMIK